MRETGPVITRFAPSPTGFLHLGHACSALLAAREAGASGASGEAREAGRLILRIEDIDATRRRPEYEAAILEDLAWLGLVWAEPVRRQSERFPDYAAALARLQAMGLIYPCFLSRRELARALSAPHDAPRPEPGGSERPAASDQAATDQAATDQAASDTDRLMTDAERARRLQAGEPYALRLRMAEALRRVGPLDWHDRAAGRQTARPEIFGDVILARKEVPTSYHLAVTLDDADQGITLVTRGEDLFQATHIHRLLQALLELPVPEYLHHPLLCDAAGRRFAKRDGAHSLRALRRAGHGPSDVRRMAGFPDA